MKKLLFFLILCIPFSSFSQKELDFESARDFISISKNNLNVLIWQKVISGNLKAYPNDSFFRPLSTEEVKDMTSIDFKVSVPNPDNPDDPYDFIVKTVHVEFDSETDFLGLFTLYEYENIGLTTGYTLVAIGPGWRPITDSGIDLGIQNMFWIKIEDLINVLDSDEREVLLALIATRDKLGDFKIIDGASNDYELLGASVGYRYIFNNTYKHDFSSLHDSIVGFHLSRVFEKLAEKANAEDEPFFKDLQLEARFENVEHDLGSVYEVMVPNPNNPDDPYDLIPKKFLALYQFDMTKDVYIHESIKGQVVQLMTKDKRSIYLKLSELLGYADKNDQILLEAYIRSIRTN